MNKIRAYLLSMDPYVEKNPILNNHDERYYTSTHIGSGVSSYYNRYSEIEWNMEYRTIPD